MADDENVKVFCRVRPPNERESGAATSALSGSAGYFARARLATGRARKCVAMPASDAQQQTLVLQNKHGVSRQFTFDRVFGEEASQTDVFQVVGAPITRACLEGYNGTIFAYGQTGSGKTFTMQGPDDVIDAEALALADAERALRGLVPRVFDFLFENVVGSSSNSGDLAVKHTFACSFLEIYNERVYDLLDGGSGKDATGLQLRESGRKGVVVDGLIESVVTSARQAAELMKIGTRNRRVGQTTMNRESSRSHSVFILQIQSQEITPEGTKTRMSRFNLVDLAGSERQRSTEAAGERLKEAGSINKSLSALGNVIMGLVDQSAGKSRHVHYRDSKLTFLLKDSLGGNSKTFMIATISPAEDSSFETLSTLKFAQRAKMIRNNAVINEDSSGSNAYLQHEVARLRQELEQAKAEAGRQGWHPSAGSLLANAAASSQEYAGDQQLELGSDHAVAVRIRELEEALASTLEKSDQLERSCDRLLVREEHLEALCAELKKNILHLKMMLRLRGAQDHDGGSKYVPSVDAVELRIKYEELEDEFVRLQEEFARCQSTDDAMDMGRNEVQSEVESLNILLMALTRQLALVVRDKHELQDRLEGKRGCEDSSMDGEDGTWDFSTRLEESLKQQAHEFESRMASLQCEVQIMEEKTAESSLELLQAKQREAAYKIQLSEADAKLLMLQLSLSNAEEEREIAKATAVQHQVRIEDLLLQIERVTESVRLDYEQQLIDSRIAHDTMATRMKQLDEQVSLLSTSRQELEGVSSELRAQLDSKQNECVALSSQLEKQMAETKQALGSLEQLKVESSDREAALAKSVEETTSIVKEKECELQAALEKIGDLESLSQEKAQAVADMTRRLAELESVVNMTTAEKHETEARARLLSEAVATLENEKHVALDKLKEMTAQHAESEKQRESAIVSLAESNARVTSLEKHNAALTSELDAASTELEKSKRSADDLQTALDDMTRAAKELEDARAKLQHEGAELSGALEQANHSIERLREEATEAAKSYEEQVARAVELARDEKDGLVKEFEHKLKLKDERISVLGGETEEANQRIQELQALEQEARAAKDQLRRDFDHLQAETTDVLAKQEAQHSQSKSQLEREIQSLVKKATEESARFEHDLSELEHQRERLQSKLDEQVRTHEDMVRSLTTEAEQLKHDVAQHVAAFKEEAAANSTLRDRVDLLVKERAEATQQLEEARSAVASLEKQLHELRSSSSEQIEALTQHVASKSEAIARLSNEKGTTSEELAELEARYKEQVAAAERLKTALDEARSKTASLESALTSELHAAADKSNGLQALLDKQTAALKQMDSANSALKENLLKEMAEKRVAEEGFAKAQTQWEDECRSLVDKSDAMQIEIQDKKKTIDEMTVAMNELEEQIGQTKGDASSKSDAIVKLREELAALTQSHKAAMEEHEQAKTLWEDEQRALNERAQELEREKRASEQSIASLQSTMVQLEQAGREAKDELWEKTEAISKLRDELAQLQKTHKALATENERMKAQQQKKSELVALEDTLKRRNMEIASAEASLRMETKKLEKRSASLAATESELKALRAESLESKRQIKKLEAANRQLAADKQKLDSDVIDLRKKLDRVSQENDKLVSHHNSRQKIQYHIRVKEQNNQLLEQVRYLTDDQFKMKRTLERMRAMLKEKENVSDNSTGGVSAPAKPKSSPVPASSPSTSVMARAKMLVAASSVASARVASSSSSSSSISRPKSPGPIKKRPRTRED